MTSFKANTKALAENQGEGVANVFFSFLLFLNNPTLFLRSILLEVNDHFTLTLLFIMKNNCLFEFMHIEKGGFPPSRSSPILKMMNEWMRLVLYDYAVDI